MYITYYILSKFYHFLNILIALLFLSLSKLIIKNKPMTKVIVKLSFEYNDISEQEAINRAASEIKQGVDDLVFEVFDEDGEFIESNYPS